MRLFAGTPFDRPPRCERCELLEADCTCPPPEPVRLTPGKQTAVIALETRKKGKSVTTIRGLSGPDTDLVQLLTTLKTTCGAGGTLKQDELEIQGDQLDKVRLTLKTIGYRVRG